MSGYRFCRTDDIDLLVDALNGCWSPHFPDEGPMTPAAFKRSIRDLQVWCSSCMVAFSGADPVGVLIGAKRATSTLVHKIAVHPAHMRHGHGRHLLASLGSKLAILGPPRLVAEVPEHLDAACRLFDAAGYVREGLLTDYILKGQGQTPADLQGGRFVIPVTVDDLAANGLLDDRPAPCWERSAETLTARKADLAGLAVASEERIEACILYIEGDAEGEIALLRTFVPGSEGLLNQLLATVRAGGIRTLRLPKVHPGEIAHNCLETLGFRSAGTYRVFAGKAQAA
jgi:GNAT superfamily N-acetyltransferase